MADTVSDGYDAQQLLTKYAQITGIAYNADWSNPARAIADANAVLKQMPRAQIEQQYADQAPGRIAGAILDKMPGAGALQQRSAEIRGDGAAAPPMPSAPGTPTPGTVAGPMVPPTATGEPPTQIPPAPGFSFAGPAFATGNPIPQPAKPAVPTFSPYDDVFRKYAGALANDPEFIHIVAAGAQAESGLNPTKVATEADGSKSIGLFGINDVHGYTPEQRMDPDFNAAKWVPQYVRAYTEIKAAQPNLSGAELASAVARQAEKPLGYQDPNGQAAQNYKNAYATVAGGAGAHGAAGTTTPGINTPDEYTKWSSGFISQLQGTGPSDHATKAVIASIAEQHALDLVQSDDPDLKLLGNKELAAIKAVRDTLEAARRTEKEPTAYDWATLQQKIDAENATSAYRTSDLNQKASQFGQTREESIRQHQDAIRAAFDAQYAKMGVPGADAGELAGARPVAGADLPASMFPPALVSQAPVIPPAPVPAGR